MFRVNKKMKDQKSAWQEVVSSFYFMLIQKFTFNCKDTLFYLYILGFELLSWRFFENINDFDFYNNSNIHNEKNNLVHKFIQAQRGRNAPCLLFFQAFLHSSFDGNAYTHRPMEICISAEIQLRTRRSANNSSFF